MNLLYDKREKSEKQGHTGMETPSSSGSTRQRHKKPAKQEKLRKPRKRISAVWLYGFIIPVGTLVLVAALIYLFKPELLLEWRQKYKAKNTINQFAQNDTTASFSQPDSMAMTQIPVDTDTGRVEQPQTQPRDTSMFAQTPQKPVEQEQRPPVSIPAGSIPSVQVMSALLQSTSTGVTVTSLYIDENTFSIGIKGATGSGLNSFYESLKSSMPPGAAITTKPGVSRSQSLIAGTYTAAPARSNPLQISGSALSAAIRKIIQKNNALNREISVSDPKTWNNRKRSQVFVKISGQLSNCQNVVRDILTGGWDLTLSKIIIMPDNSTSGTLVFRFFLNNPA